MKKKTESSKNVEPILLRSPMAIHPSNLPCLTEDGSARICVVVAEKLVYGVGKEQKTYKMEAGRISAQAAHAVSALKLKYCLRFGDSPEFDDIRNVVDLVQHTPITTIVLGARDNNEVAHVITLAEKSDLLCEPFYDDNLGVYGTTDRILTAVAIGPLSKMSFTGISDYLPLYKAAGEA